MHYLDNAATTAVLPEAAQAAMNAMCETFGNPSSLHKMGIEASKLLENSREIVASAINASAEELVFTSCGTESTNIAIQGTAHLNRHKKGRIITTAIEHAATINMVKQLEAEGFETIFLLPNADGHIEIEAFEKAFTENTVLVTCQLINNEIGTLQPVEQIGKMIKRSGYKTLFHIDAVQGFCRMKIEPKAWNCDLMSISGHKIGAPKGIGALYIKKGLRLPPLMHGGGQEKGIRPGTEALPMIAAFGAACEIKQKNFEKDLEHVSNLAKYFEQSVVDNLANAMFNGNSDTPFMRNLSIPHCKSEVMLRVLESDEVYVSSGSACSKGKQSSVLQAIGLPKERTDTALRVSFSPSNTKADIDAFIAAAQKGMKMLNPKGR